MDKREIFQKLIISFFIVVTSINVAMGTLGLIFEPDQRFGYEAFFMPLLYGVIGMIPAAIVSGKKEISVKQMVIRKILEIILIEILLTGFLWSNGVKDGNVVAAFMASVLIICVLTELVLWMLNCSAARKLNEDLKLFKQKVRES